VTAVIARCHKRDIVQQTKSESTIMYAVTLITQTAGCILVILKAQCTDCHVLSSLKNRVL